MARPVKFKVDDIIEALNRYIDDTEDPLIKEFCLQYGISSVHFYKLAKSNDELSKTIKRATDKQEVYLVRVATDAVKSPTGAIFRLKQPVHGYTDRQDVKVSGNVSFGGEDDLTD
jgi:hypothetical protein